MCFAKACATCASLNVHRHRQLCFSALFTVQHTSSLSHVNIVTLASCVIVYYVLFDHVLYGPAVSKATVDVSCQ